MIKQLLPSLLLVALCGCFKTKDELNLNALLASPYGKAHGLTLRIENGTLRLQAVTGIEAAARLADMKEDAGLFGDAMPGLDELKK